MVGVVERCRHDTTPRRQLQCVWQGNICWLSLWLPNFGVLAIKVWLICRCVVAQWQYKADVEKMLDCFRLCPAEQPRPPTPHGHLFPRGNKWQVGSNSEKWKNAVDVTVICARVQRTWNCAKGAVKCCYATWNLRKRKLWSPIFKCK